MQIERIFIYFLLFVSVSYHSFAQNIIHITHDVDLSKSKDFVITNNTILSFEGGCLKNGTIKGINTAISAPMYPIFQNVKLEGTWSVPTAFFEWFGAKGDGKTDDRESIQNALNSPFRSFTLPTKNYVIATDKASSVGLIISHPIKIQGTAQYDFDGGTTISVAPKSTFSTMIQIKSQGVELENMIITGNGGNVKNIISTHEDNEYYTRLTLRKIAARNCNETCIDLRTFGSRLEQVTTGYCNIGFFIHGNERKQELYTSNILEGCVCFSARQYAYKFSYLTYSTLTACAGDRNGFNDESKSYDGYPYYFFGCSNITMNSCGCESSYNTIHLDCCKNFIVNTMTDWSGKDKTQDGYQAQKQIFLQNCQNISFLNCTIGSKISKDPYITLKQSTNVQFMSCNPRKNGGKSDTSNISRQDCTLDEKSTVAIQ